MKKIRKCTVIIPSWPPVPEIVRDCPAPILKQIWLMEFLLLTLSSSVCISIGLSFCEVPSVSESQGCSLSRRFPIQRCLTCRFAFHQTNRQIDAKPYSSLSENCIAMKRTTSKTYLLHARTWPSQHRLLHRWLTSGVKGWIDGILSSLKEVEMSKTQELHA